MSNNRDLPVDVRHANSVDVRAAAAESGLPVRKIGGGKGQYIIPVKEESELLDEVRFGYLKVLEMHALANNATPPTAAEVWACSRKGALVRKLTETIVKGNIYDKLKPTATNKENSSLWQIAEQLMRSPEKFGIEGVPALMADVEIDHGLGRVNTGSQAKD